jgi:hypothetical protein
MLTFLCADPAIEIPPIFVFEGKMVSKNSSLIVKPKFLELPAWRHDVGEPNSSCSKTSCSISSKMSKHRICLINIMFCFLTHPMCTDMSSAAFQLCLDNKIILIRFPSQTTHWLQPLV